VTGDANEYPLDGYDIVTGGPPCTGHSTLRNAADKGRGRTAGTEWMLGHHLARVQEWAQRTGGLWVVENVTGARRKMPSPMKLCGTMFDLEDGGWSLQRHRWFSTNLPLIAPPGPCRHKGRKFIGIYGDLTENDRKCSGKREGRPNGDMRASVERSRRLLGMPWAGADGLRLAVPVAYGTYFGEQLVMSLDARRRAAA
jgi:hypothetical protein